MYNVAFFGERIGPRIKIYKGDTLKKSIAISLEGQSRITDPVSISMDSKYAEATFSIPLVIFDSCTLPEGSYLLIAEGLDVRAEQEILVQQKGSCKDSPEKSSAESKGAEAQFSDPILSFYTLTKKFSTGQEAKLFGRIDASQEREVILENRQDEILVFSEEFKVQRGEIPVKFTFNVTPYPGENVFSLAVKGIPETRKEILITTDIPPEKKGNSSSSVYTSVFLNNSPVFAVNRTKEGIVTGNVIYEKGPVKYLKTLLVIVFVLASLVVWREGKKHYAKRRYKGISRKGLHTHKGHVRSLRQPKRTRRIIAQELSQANKGRVPDKDH